MTTNQETADINYSMSLENQEMEQNNDTDLENFTPNQVELNDQTWLRKIEDVPEEILIQALGERLIKALVERFESELNEYLVCLKEKLKNDENNMLYQPLRLPLWKGLNNKAKELCKKPVVISMNQLQRQGFEIKIDPKQLEHIDCHDDRATRLGGKLMNFLEDSKDDRNKRLVKQHCNPSELEEEFKNDRNFLPEDHKRELIQFKKQQRLPQLERKRGYNEFFLAETEIHKRAKLQPFFPWELEKIFNSKPLILYQEEIMNKCKRNSLVQLHQQQRETSDTLTCEPDKLLGNHQWKLSEPDTDFQAIINSQPEEHSVTLEDFKCESQAFPGKLFRKIAQIASSDDGSFQPFQFLENLVDASPFTNGEGEERTKTDGIPNQKETVLGGPCSALDSCIPVSSLYATKEKPEERTAAVSKPNRRGLLWTFLLPWNYRPRELEEITFAESESYQQLLLCLEALLWRYPFKHPVSGDSLRGRRRNKNKKSVNFKTKESQRNVIDLMKKKTQRETLYWKKIKKIQYNQGSGTSFDTIKKTTRQIKISEFKREPTTLLKSYPTRCSSSLIVLGQYYADNVTESWSTKTQSWSTQIQIPDIISDNTLAVTTNDVIIILESDSNWKRMRSVSLLHNQWTELTPPPEFTRGMSATALGNSVYLTGGCYDIYDVKKDRWCKFSEANVCRYKHASATLSGKIYCCGGMDAKGKLTRTVEMYDPIKKRWSFVAEMVVKRTNFALASCGRYLWAVGGKNGSTILNDLERYGPQQDEWVLMKPMNIKKREVKAYFWSGFLYVFGSKPQGDGVLIEKYNPQESVWDKNDPYQVLLSSCLSSEKKFVVAGPIFGDFV